MTYFANCTTIDDAKREYRRLARLNHPDMGGKTEVMQDINSQYEYFRVHGFPFCGNSAADTADKPKTEKAYQKQKRKSYKKTVYRHDQVFKTVDVTVKAGGTVRYFDDGKTVVIYRKGFKTIVAKFYRITSENVALYTVRQYNDTPKKYQ